MLSFTTIYHTSLYLPVPAQDHFDVSQQTKKKKKKLLARKLSAMHLPRCIYLIHGLVGDSPCARPYAPYASIIHSDSLHFATGLLSDLDRARAAVRARTTV